MRTLWNWLCKDAEWYHFWRPQSGLEGGFVMGVLVCVVVGLLYVLIR